MYKLSTLWAAALLFAATSCVQNDKQENTPSATPRTPLFEIEECNLTLGGIEFTHMINNANECVKDSAGVVYFDAPEGTDVFIDPNDGKLSNGTVKVMLKKIDNSTPFTLTAKVKPEFTEAGLYNAATLFVAANDTVWQKLCYEQDEWGRHRVVTVRTKGTSDDNNHQEILQDVVYFKISSDTRTIASYYSLDGEQWNMVRLYKNDYPDSLYVGISSQCPIVGGCLSEFSQMTFSTTHVADFRLGK